MKSLDDRFETQMRKLENIRVHLENNYGKLEQLISQAKQLEKNAEDVALAMNETMFLKDVRDNKLRVVHADTGLPVNIAWVA